MSLSEERMLVLKMLQEGKITTEEAAKLLEALDGSASRNKSEDTSKQQKQSNFYDEVNKMRERINEWKKDFKKNYNKKDFEKAVEDFSVKAEKIGKEVASATFGVIDKIVDFVGSFVETNSFNFFGSFNPTEVSFTAADAEGKDLIIEGLNGNIHVKKHDEENIVVKSRIRSMAETPEDLVVFNTSENTVELKLQKRGNFSVSHEIFVPSAKFNKILLETTNGRIFVEDTLSKEFEARTKNNSIDLTGVNSGKISVSTKNSKVRLGYITCETVDIETGNSVVEVKSIKARRINISALNGRISVENVQNTADSKETTLNLKTANGDVKVNMNDLSDRGYRINAKTRNGGINLLVPEIVYRNVNKEGATGSFIEAESSRYDELDEKVNINVETSNGYIEIVK